MVHLDREYTVYTLPPHLIYGVDYRRSPQAACDLYYNRIIYLRRPCVPPHQQPVPHAYPKKPSTLPASLFLHGPRGHLTHRYNTLLIIDVVDV